MSDQEKKSGSGGGSPAVIVDQTPNNRLKAPYRPTDLQDDTEPHHKHIRAPAVQSVAEELKILTQGSTASEISEDKEHKDYKRVIPPDMNKQNVAKKLSSSPKKRNSSPESIVLAPMEVDTKKGSITPPTQPIPQDVETISEAEFTTEKEAAQKEDTDSITEEISEGRTVEPTKKHSNWSDDDEEAGGLPRSESRASRVSRVVRQFFCCGVPYEAPSEENISSGRAFGQGI
ncbi:uncharacterized protein LOC123696478 isoform X1 [Colias croceus]|uniref:uncharacterized protein LOC123696478 isoform X1 n=1 Tax=Colias crocea TaxID=72248 RepID=UPI001E27D652|nr:uncharacterized protein LOC123696478 isoform X1 [Colias croceus]